MSTAEARSLNRADGTLTLLRTGSAVTLAGVVAYACIPLFLGGIARHGPSGSLAWILLMVALMCLPFGLLLLGLGAAKWLRNQRLARQG